jgi:hypothetical protein
MTTIMLSLLLFRALQLADIPFEQNCYPEEDHYLFRVRKSLHRTYTSYWAKCFGFLSNI